MWQFKKMGQPVRAELISEEDGKVRITNKYLFTNLSDLRTEWMLQADGEIIEKGELKLDIKPLESEIVTVPFHKPALKEGAEYRLTLSFIRRRRQCGLSRDSRLPGISLISPGTNQYKKMVKALLNLSGYRRKRDS